MGPTGIGKTNLAFELYDSADVEIISVDSVQVYKHLNIGSVIIIAFWGIGK